MRAPGTWLLFLLALGCSTSRPLGDAPGGALGPSGAGATLGSSDGTGGAGGALGQSGAAGGATDDDAGSALRPSDTVDGSSVDCGPPTETAPCRTDFDCRSAYLVCVPPDYVTIELCRDPDAGADPSPACPVFPQYATAPSCPQTVRVTSTVCEVRYQRPCTVDSDCGPAGFMCAGGGCRQTQSGAPCNSASDCPTGWQCYAPCACSTSGVAATSVCEPPFAQFGCPACPAN
jgi:hypothetical protein